MGMSSNIVIDYANMLFRHANTFPTQRHCGKECAEAMNAQVSEERDNVLSGSSVVPESQQRGGQYREHQDSTKCKKCFGLHLSGSGRLT